MVRRHLVAMEDEVAPPGIEPPELPEAGGVLFGLRNLEYLPEAPAMKEAFAVKGEVTLFGLKLITPCWVIASVNYPGTFWEAINPFIGPPSEGISTFVIGGSFDITFQKGFDREGEYQLVVQLYPGPAFPGPLGGKIPPVPAVSTHEAYFTVEGEAAPGYEEPPGIEPGEVSGDERAVARYPDAGYESMPVGAPTQEVSGPELKVDRYPESGYVSIPVGDSTPEEETGSEIKVDRYPSSGYATIPVVAVSPGEYLQITNVGSVSEASYGQMVYVWVKIENLWDDRLSAQVTLLVDGEMIETIESDITPGVWSWPRMEFTMPNKTVAMMVIAKYWSGSAWVEADRETKTISLK